MKLYRAGMPTLLECETLEQNVALCRELGLSFIELNMDVPIYSPERLPASTLRQIHEETGIFFTAHMPELIDLASFHPSIRQGHLQRCLEIIQWAKEAGIKLLNLHLHPGIYFTLPHGKAWINAQYEAEFLELLMHSFEQLYAWSRQYEVPVCLENTLNFHHAFIQNALLQLSRFDEFQLTWDVGHDAKSGYQDRPVILEHVSRVGHLHVHDFDGKSDHLTLGSGVVALQEHLEFARTHDLTFVIETKTADALRQSCRWLMKRLSAETIS
jgi:sugar phosphate isomerase/epimerase